MKQGYRTKETCVFLMNYHIIWRPKRRRKVLVDRVKTRLDELIRETAPFLECELLALEIVPDHLHVFVSATPQWAPNQIIARLKGTSSRILRAEFPILQRMPSLWTRSYFISTAGHVSSDTIRRYIEAQSTRD
ncbi:MAG: IS200/IS605 family transposase [Chloroflexales bacterium]|nr:IS200/IS605 family transposase [Chloroflexales bacterium]